MFDHSDSLAKLGPALVKALAKVKHPAKNATNPHLRNKFADLHSIIETVRPTLAEHGIAVTQMTGGDGSSVSVTTILMHESGEYIASTASVPLDGAGNKGMNAFQVAGSAYTYLRRYGLAAVCGVTADPDDDGNEMKDLPSRNGKADEAHVDDMF